MAVQFLPLRSGAAVYDPADVDRDALAAVLEDGLAASSTPLAGSAGREGVRLIERCERTWVWRHNRRGGWCGRFIQDSYVWSGAANTRAYREWYLLHELKRLGLPVPHPIAAIYERRGLLYRSDLITELIPDAGTLSSRLCRAPLPLHVWRRIGDCIRRFHAFGVFHADLNAHNILLGPADQVYLIDFDRGEFRQPGRWTEGNWSRLKRSLLKVSVPLPADRFGPEQWSAMYDSTRPPWPVPARPAAVGI